MRQQAWFTEGAIPSQSHLFLISFLVFALAFVLNCELVVVATQKHPCFIVDCHLIVFDGHVQLCLRCECIGVEC